MRKLLLAAVLACAPALAGCSTMGLPSVPTAPAQVAERTVLDEQVGAGVELAYKAFRTALEVATDAGIIRGARATQVAALDNRAFAAVQAVRAAYRAGNATGYANAAIEARAAITAALAAVKGN